MFLLYKYFLFLIKEMECFRSSLYVFVGVRTRVFFRFVLFLVLTCILMWFFISATEKKGWEGCREFL